MIVLFASSIPALYGQDPAKTSQKGKDKGNITETTMTGCLNKGPGQGYVLTDQNTGEKVTVTGPSELEQHSTNHTVKLTGSQTTQGGQTMLNVTKIEHVSPTCMPPAANKK
ncbi:MAG: hypothetical protein JWO19_4696 [Bryobacterales bacterium]|jgi:hypothetical protein|nr:hypothetical protein [Bryobacterales bacterium]